jgi:hypothetical protein
MNTVKENREEIELKDRVYIEKKQSKSLIYFALIILLIYIVFFTSKLWIHKPLSTETKVGQKVNYMQDRSVTLISSIYDKDKKTMEIVLAYENKSLDNVNDYHYAYTISEQRFSKPVFKEIYNKPLFSVIRIENLKKGYREVKIFLAPKIVSRDKVKDNITASIVLNKKNVKNSSIDLNKTEKEYILDRLNSLYKYQEKKIADKESEIKKAKSEIKAIDEKKKTFEANKKYMSDSEIKNQKAEIDSLEDTKLKLEQGLDEKYEELKALEDELKSLKNRKKRVD